MTGTVCGDPVTLSDMLSEAVRVPVAVGLKAIEMLHLAPAATLLPQLFVWL